MKEHIYTFLAKKLKSTLLDISCELSISQKSVKENIKPYLDTEEILKEGDYYIFNKEKTIPVIGNLNVAKELIKKYRELGSYENTEILNIANKFGHNNYSSILGRITGFGGYNTCSLCTAVEGNCSKCVWVVASNGLCDNVDNKTTYDNIAWSNTIKEMKKALLDRAEHLEGWLEEFEIMKKAFLTQTKHNIYSEFMTRR